MRKHNRGTRATPGRGWVWRKLRERVGDWSLTVAEVLK